MILKDGLVFDLEQGFVQRDLYTDGSLISEASGDNTVIDATDCYVIPGLVDVHFHGCLGEDFSDATREGLQRIADFELSEGVTYITPTSMTLAEETLMEICKNVAAHRAESTSGAEVVGAHLEGPFLGAFVQTDSAAAAEVEAALLALAAQTEVQELLQSAGYTLDTQKDSAAFTEEVKEDLNRGFALRIGGVSVKYIK